MDPASAFGLAASAYSICHQCFNILNQARNFGPDGDVFRCQLAWEEHRLERWGAATNIDKWTEVDSKTVLSGSLPGGVKQLNWSLIGHTLRVLQNRLQDLNTLKERYNLVMSEDGGTSVEETHSKKSLRKILGIKEPTPSQISQPKTTVVRKLRWVATDKDGAKALLVDVASLNDRLMEFLESSERQKMSETLEELLKIAKNNARSPSDQALADHIVDTQIARRKSEREKDELAKKLFKAIREGQLEEVRSLFKEGATNNCYYSGWPPLSRAIEANQLSIAKFLVSEGANVNYHEGGGGMTTLLIAATSGDEDMITWLFQSGVSKAFADPSKMHPVREAAKRGNTSGLRGLLQDSAFMKMDTADDRNCTALFQAALNGHAEATKLLMQHFPDDINRAGYRDGPPLVASSQHQDHLETVKVLLDHPKIDVNATDANGRTALLHAAKHNSTEILDALVSAGADAKHQDKEGHNALTVAVDWHYENESVLTRLLGYSDININAASTFGSALCIAARDGHHKTVEQLLSCFPDLEIRDAEGRTALAIAAQNGHRIVVRKLLKAGAKVDPRDKMEKTPLMMAARNGHQLVVEMLLNSGASMDMEDEDGDTAVDYARVGGHDRMVGMLSD